MKQNPGRVGGGARHLGGVGRRIRVGRVGIVVALGVLLVAVGVVHTIGSAPAAQPSIGHAPDRFGPAQLDDPSFHPDRGFWDIKGVTNFVGAPDPASAMATMGIGRLDTSWAAFEPTRLALPCPSGYDTFEGHCFKPPADVDAQIKAFTAAGLPVMAIVFATPAWARGARPCVPYNAWSDVFCVPDHPEDAARFAAYLAYHYDGASGNGRITDFVIQNEVNLNQWFDTGCGAGVPCNLDSWVQDYADIYDLSYDAIRAVQPNAEVLIPLTQHFEKVLDRPDDVHPSYSIKTFLPKLVPLLGNRAWELALHPYPRSVTPTIDARDLPYATLGDPGVVVGWLRATYPDVPSAWNVEFTEQGLNNPGMFDAQQAASLCQAFEGVLGTPGVKSFIYHSLHDNLGEFGLYLGLITADGVPKPAYSTWLHANDLSDPTCGFENAGTTVVRTGTDPETGAVWTSSRPLPSGYVMQTRQWRLAYDAQPGTVMAYECGDGNDDATVPTYPSSTWLSTAPDCGGATPMGPVGWISTSPGAGATRLVTCSTATTRRTLEGACPTGVATTTVGWADAEPVPEAVLAAANTTTTTTTTVPVDVDHPDLSSYDAVFTLESGTFRVGAAGTIPLPDGRPGSGGRTYLVGNWNRSNGALELQLLVPSFTTPVTTSILPDPVPITFTMTQIGTGIGSLDPTTGVFRLDITINTRLGSPDALFAGFLGTNCEMGPASLTLRSVAPFDLSHPDPEATITDSGFAFPAAHGCGSNGGLDQVLNPALELPTTATDATLRVVFSKGAPVEPATTTTTVVPTTTTAAATSLPAPSASTSTSAPPMPGPPPTGPADPIAGPEGPLVAAAPRPVTRVPDYVG